MLACLNPGDKILGFDLSHGGHLTHGSAVNFSGKLYQPSFYGVERETGLIDWSKIKDIARRERPKLIICGASAYSRDWDYKTLREAADEVGALLLADISHPSALIATGLLNSPFEHCHIVTTTTHKTLRGPRGGLILLGKDFENPFGLKTPKGEIRPMSALLDSAVFPRRLRAEDRQRRLPRHAGRPARARHRRQSRGFWRSAERRLQNLH